MGSNYGYYMGKFLQLEGVEFSRRVARPLSWLVLLMTCVSSQKLGSLGHVVLSFSSFSFCLEHVITKLGTQLHAPGPRRSEGSVLGMHRLG